MIPVRPITLEYVEELEAENAYLRSELGLSDDEAAIADIRKSLGVTTQVAQVLLALYATKGRPLNRYALEARVPTKFVEERFAPLAFIGVRICQLRKALPPESIETVWGQGYRLTPIGLEVVRQLLDTREAA